MGVPPRCPPARTPRDAEHAEPAETCAGRSCGRRPTGANSTASVLCGSPFPRREGGQGVRFSQPSMLYWRGRGPAIAPCHHSSCWRRAVCRIRVEDETIEVIEVEEEPHPNPLQAIAQQQVEYVVIGASTVATTIFTVLASAAGLVAALAWNTALSAWLPTVITLDDPLAKDFAYAGIATASRGGDDHPARRRQQPLPAQAPPQAHTEVRRQIAHSGRARHAHCLPGPSVCWTIQVPRPFVE